MRTQVTIEPGKPRMTIVIYPYTYELYSDLDLDCSVYDTRKDAYVEVIKGYEVLKRIRGKISNRQMVVIEKWIFDHV